MTVTILSGEATVLCIGCQHDVPADATADLTIHATVDGRNSKHRAKFCLVCWMETLEPMLGVVLPAHPTGSVWEP